jgi:hypothetical protein
MSVYESIKRSSLAVKRQLFDFNVGLLGQKVRAIKISYSEDIFQDTQVDSILSASEIYLIIRFPSEMPLDRYRLDSSVSTAETRTYFYDLLPIEGYTKLEDKIEKNDFIFFFLEDEQNNKIPYLLQATDTFGKFEIGLIWKKAYYAPYHGTLSQTIISYLEESIITDYYDTYKEENPDEVYISTRDELEEYHAEEFTNLFPFPLNPRNQTVTLEAGDYVGQCAFGSFSFDSFSVSYDIPLQFTLEEEETLSILVSSDCKFPSIYQSDFFHPFVSDSREAFYTTRTLAEETINFQIDFIVTEKSAVGSFVLSDTDHILLEDDISIIGFRDTDEYRSIFYIEGDDGQFISFKMTSGFELLVQGLTASSFSYSFGAPETNQINVSLIIETNTINITVDSTSYEITGTSDLLGKTVYFGYEPEKYLNDFIRQVYS